MNLPAEPLVFEPIYKKVLWGGTTLHTRLGKSLPQGKIAESWELSGFGGDQSIVAKGLLKGTPLSTLVANYPEQLIGDSELFTAFPLLYKFIDAADRLSVQVHPDDDQARANGWGDFGKTECWYVVDCREDARCIVGFNRDITRTELAGAAAGSSLNGLLDYVSIRPGDLLLVPAGTVHAIMEGTLIYEVQETSDTTFRLYDWSRVDATGVPRKLHIREACSVADIRARNHRPLPGVTLEDNGVIHSIRVACRYFALEQFLFDRDSQAVIAPRNSFRVCTSVAGDVEISHPGGKLELPLGTTALLPAHMGEVRVAGTAGTRLLVSWIPDLRREVIAPLKAKGISDRAILELGGYGPRNDLAELLRRGC